ncbi:MAG: pyrroline-5-carboxylate reductase [Phycisphaerae bacterium]|nr:pyrroline-5-carboxylate reductase [Phycisphaerae bacterium]
MDTAGTELAVIGVGNMGAAIVRGVLSAGMFPAERIGLADPDPSRLEPFRARGCCVGARAADVVRGSSSGGMLLLAVKPQVFRLVAAELLGVRPSGTVISIMAGVSSASITSALKTERVVRAMPNLAVSLGKGVTAVAPSGGTRESDIRSARGLFEPLGEVLTCEERLMDAFTALAGSGPAYLFYLAEAMERAAVEMGFDRKVAGVIVRRTLSGAAALLDAGREDGPGALRARVTSKGGTTDVACRVMDEAGVASSIRDAIVAARDRGRELAS